MGGMILGSLANILLDYLFHHGVRMGIMFGAAFATGIAPILSSMAVLSIHFIKGARSGR